MKYTAKKITRAMTSRLTGKTTDMSGWYVMKGSEWEKGPMTESEAKKLATTYNSRKA